MIKVFIGGDYNGLIFKEFPQFYPQDYTIGIKSIPYNFIGSLSSCIEFLANQFNDDVELIWS